MRYAIWLTLILACGCARLPREPEGVPYSERSRSQGHRLFEAACARCHGSDGKGVAGGGPALVGSELLQRPDREVLRVIADGRQRPGHRQMPRKGGYPELSTTEIEEILAHLRGLNDQSGGPGEAR